MIDRCSRKDGNETRIRLTQTDFLALTFIGNACCTEASQGNTVWSTTIAVNKHCTTSCYNAIVLENLANLLRISLPYTLS